MLDLFRHLRIHTKKKDAPEEMDFPEMYLMGLGATTELPENFESNFDHKKYFNDLRKQAVDVYKSTGNFALFREDIDRLDTIEDILEFRFSIFKDYNKAFADHNDVVKKGKGADTSR